MGFRFLKIFPLSIIFAFSVNVFADVKPMTVDEINNYIKSKSKENGSKGVRLDLGGHPGSYIIIYVVSVKVDNNQNYIVTANDRKEYKLDKTQVFNLFNNLINESSVVETPKQEAPQREKPVLGDAHLPEKKATSLDETNLDALVIIEEKKPVMKQLVARSPIAKLSTIKVTKEIEVSLIKNSIPQTVKIRSGEITIIDDNGIVATGVLKNADGMDSHVTVNIHRDYLDELVLDDSRRGEITALVPMEEIEDIRTGEILVKATHAPHLISINEEYIVPPGKWLSTQDQNGKAFSVSPGSIIKVINKAGSGSGVRAWGNEVEILASSDESIVGKKVFTSTYNFQLLEQITDDTEILNETVQNAVLTQMEIKELIAPHKKMLQNACSENMFSLTSLKSFEDKDELNEYSKFKQGAELEAYLDCYNQNNPHYKKPEMKNYLEWIKNAAQSFGLPEAILACLIMRESKFNPKAKSQYARGIAQFTPGTIETIHGFLFNQKTDPEKIKELESKMTSLLAKNGGDSTRWNDQEKKNYTYLRHLHQRILVIEEGKKGWNAFFGGRPPQHISADNPKTAIALSAFYLKYILNKIDFELNYEQSGAFAERQQSDIKKKAAKKLSMLELAVLSTGMYNAGPSKMSRVFIANESTQFSTMVSHAPAETKKHMTSIKQCAEQGNPECMTGDESLCHVYKACFSNKMGAF